MYPYTFPHTIAYEGEEMTFESRETENGVEKLIVTNKIKPGHGPPFHVHFRQEEGFKVVKGLLGYQIYGGEEKFLNEGESAVFDRGQVHRFWNAGEGILECRGWLKPANTIDFFLTSVYESMNKAGHHKGDPFDMAYLIIRYKSEYDMLVIPSFVKRVIMPATVVVGKLLGKYEHFKDAPEPLK